MPDEVLEKVQYLCREFSEVEWSGILLYDFIGGIKDPGNMVITLRDIIPMNKGNATYTEYSFTEKARDQSGYADKHIDFCEENEEALGWNIGHIHSHNHMQVYFSGTDMKELEDNCGSHNFYLSFIVNNKMDFTAKIAIAAHIEETVKCNYKALDENGEEYIIQKDISLNVKKSKMITYDCSIESNKDTVKIEKKNFFLRCVDSIMETVKPKPKYAAPKNSYQNPWQGVSTQKNLFDDLDKAKGVNSSWSNPSPESDIDAIEDFCKDLFNVTGKPLPQSATLEVVIKSSILFKNLPGHIINKIPEVYQEHFGDANGINDEDFLYYMEEAMGMISAYMPKYPVLEAVVDQMEQLVSKFLILDNK